MTNDVTLARICTHAWGRAGEMTARLRAAGFGPDHWPDYADLAKLPVLDKRGLGELQRATSPLGALDAGNSGCLFLSTGGIMEPDLPAAEERLAAWFARCGLTPDDVVLNGFSYHLTPAGLLFHGALRRLGCRVLPAGPQNADAALSLAARSRVTGFVGIASHLKQLLTKAEASALRVGRDLPLRIAFAGGEPFGGPIRRELVERHGIACFDFYGSADLGVVAGETTGKEGFELFDGVVAEVLELLTNERLPRGEPGHLVLSVDNPNYPLLRLGTGDIAALTASEPARLLGPFGRVDASARVRGLLLYERQVAQAFAAHQAIWGGWVEVSRRDGRDGLAASLLVEPGAWDAAAAAFQAAFQSACRLSLDEIRAADAAAAPDASTLRDLRAR